MGFTLIYSDEVYDDLQHAVDWYNEKQIGLGLRFLNAVKKQLQRIKKSPKNFAIRYENVRCSKIEKFPYLVHFKIFPENNIIKITAVFSTHRNPKIWNERKLE